MGKYKKLLQRIESLEAFIGCGYAPSVEGDGMHLTLEWGNTKNIKDHIEEAEKTKKENK
jgi:hypothetical protein